MDPNSATHARPKLDRALTFLARSRIGIADGVWAHRSIAQLATEANVSYVTMWKAVSESRKRRIDVRTTDFPGGDLLWKRVGSELQGRILSGAYAPAATLPSHKQLQAEFGVSFVTIKKALRWLCAENLVVARSRGYKVAGATRAEGNLSIALIIPHDYSARILWGRQGRDYPRVFELSCATLGIQFELVYSRPGAAEVELVRTSGEAISLDGADFDGYAYLVTSQDAVHAVTIGRLLQHEVPVAVLNESGEWVCPQPLRSRTGVCVFPIAASSNTGTTMARYLIQQGHRRAAYFTPFGDSGWSRQRLAGIETTFVKAGLDGAITAHTIETQQWSGTQAKTRHSMLQVINAFRQSQPPAITEHLEPVLESLWSFHAEGAAIRHLLTPHFETALTDSTISIWICANDFVAAMALDFLNAKGTRVPQDIAVAGFDNDDIASLRRLTSVDFNIPRIVSAALFFLSGPRGGRKRENDIEVDCEVIERESTRCGRR